MKKTKDDANLKKICGKQKIRKRIKEILVINMSDKLDSVWR